MSRGRHYGLEPPPRTDAQLYAVNPCRILPVQRYVDVMLGEQSRRLVVDQADQVRLPGGAAWSRDVLVRLAARQGWTLRWGGTDPMRSEEDER
jgi:hypothetical protein